MYTPTNLSYRYCSFTIEDKDKERQNMGKLFSTPWKETDIDNWNNEVLKKLKSDIKEYSKKEINILLFGCSGQGKSAFVNTAFSSLYGRLITEAAEGSSSLESITQGLKEHSLRDSVQSDDWKVTIFDMQGVERIIGLKEIIKILDGIVTQTQFPSEEFKKYNINKPIHAVLFCKMYTENFSLGDDGEIFKACITYASQKEIPVFLLMTMIDKCVPPKGEFDVSRVFYYEALMKATKEAASTFGVPEKNILLQRNYSGAQHGIVNKDIDILTLYNLRFILGNFNIN